MKTSEHFRLAALLGGLLLTAHFAVAQPCVPAPSGAVAWWRAEGNAQDAVGTHHGTLQGAAGYSSGQVGQAFSLDGADGSYVSVPDSTDWDFGLNDFTIELWVKFNEIKRVMFVCQQSGAGAGGFEFDFQAGGVGLVFARNPSAGVSRPWSPSPVINTWYHVAVTRQSGTYRLYVNGVQQGAEEFDSNPVSNVTGSLRLGSYTGENGYGVNGLMDEFSIYSRALSAAELLAIFNASSGGKCGLGQAAGLSISWFTVDGGGSTSKSSDGRFSVSGTAGQPDAGQSASTDGRFQLNGGFWYGETIFCGCTLSIIYSGGKVTISWPCDLNGCILEYADELHGPPAPIIWTPVSPQPTGHSYITPVTGTQRYFRLRSP